MIESTKLVKALSVARGKDIPYCLRARRPTNLDMSLNDATIAATKLNCRIYAEMVVNSNS